jgi:hypothetical protein
MLLQGFVEIHHRLYRRIEAGQQFVADNQEARLSAEFLEPLLGISRIIEIVCLKLSTHGGNILVLGGFVVLLRLRIDAGDHGVSFLPGRIFVHAALH